MRLVQGPAHHLRVPHLQNRPLRRRFPVHSLECQTLQLILQVGLQLLPDTGAVRFESYVTQHSVTPCVKALFHPASPSLKAQQALFIYAQYT